MKLVTIIQRVLPHYRIPFFERIYERLLEYDIVLHLIYGQEYYGSVPKTFDLNKPWAFKVHNNYFKVLNSEFVWQPCLRYLKQSELIIVEQANRLLVNYILLSRLITKDTKIAFWGHGKNLQSIKSNCLKEAFKRYHVKTVDWWFAYTAMSAKIVEERGFEKNKISIINNSIDTESLSSACNEVKDQEINNIKRGIGINSENVCIYCGGMYKDKKLNFLIDACIIIRSIIKDFHMIFIGDGPLQQVISDICDRYSWMHYIGPKYGNEKVPYLKAAKAILMPGPVGLVIIDSFVAKVPMITTNIPLHGPEIDYLENYKNGVIADFDINNYSNEVTKFLKEPEKQICLKKGCADSAKKYSMENMINSFISGITSCLSLRD